MVKFSGRSKGHAPRSLTRSITAARLSPPTSPKPSASMEGWLRKRTTKSGVRKVWCERYFVLRGPSLSYYIRHIDTEAKATFELTEGCQVSDVYFGSRKERSSSISTPNTGAATNHELHDDEASNGSSSINPPASDLEFSNSPARPRRIKGSKVPKSHRERLYCIKVTWPASKTQAQSRDEEEANRVLKELKDPVTECQSTPVAANTLGVTSERKGRSRSPLKRASSESSFTSADNAHSSQMEHSPPLSPGSIARDASDEALMPRVVDKDDGYAQVVLPSKTKKDKGRGAIAASAPPTQSPTSTSAPSQGIKPSTLLAASPKGKRRTKSLSSTSAVLKLPPGEGSERPALRRVPSEGSERKSERPSLRRSPSEGSPTYKTPPTSRSKQSASITEGIPIIPSLGTHDPETISPQQVLASLSNDSSNGDERTTSARLQRHYEEQIIIQKQEEMVEKNAAATNVLSAKTSRQQQEEMYKLMYIAAKKSTQKKYRKRLVMGAKVAAAGGAAITATALTAGVGLVAGLVFVGIAGGLSGTGAAAGAAIGRGPGSKKLVLAAATLDDALAWKEALERAVRELSQEDLTEEAELSDDNHIEEDVSKTWKVMFDQEGRNSNACTLTTQKDGGEEVIKIARSLHVGGLGGDATGAQKIARTGSIFTPGVRWRPLEVNFATLLGTGAHGLRIFCEEKGEEAKLTSRPVRRIFRSRVGVEGHPSPPLKAHVVLNANPLNAFMCLMCNGRIQNTDLNSEDCETLSLCPNSGQVASFRIVKTLDDHMDIIQLVMRPLYLFPSWTAPRDFVLVRYWRLEADGTYFVCYDSIEHRDCPPTPGYVRGDLHSVFTIAPRKRSRRHSECLLTHVVQMDPRGWVPTLSVPILSNYGYVEAFQVSALLQMIDVRDALDHDRFVPVALGAMPHKHWSSSKKLYTENDGETNYSSGENERYDNISRASSAEIEEEEDESAGNYDFTYASQERTSHDLLETKCQYSGGISVLSVVPSPESERGLNTISNDPPALLADWWSEPDANSFRVRGKTYKTDKKKVNAGSTLFRLIATDIIQVDASIFDGICHHPQERVQKAMQREKVLKSKGLPSDMPPFVVCINIVLPGPPYYHFATYYAVEDMSLINGADGTPSSKLCNEFFFGDSDEFRDKTFKLIPQIVEGNFVVRKAVGSTPAIMGTKLKQTYVRTDRFFEVVLDIGSSSVAAGVIRLCSGYAKQIVVDLAFLLEGNDESMLPERVFGTVRLKNIEFGKKLRFLQTGDVDVDDE
mmetsp:Transcript_36637/g.53677  ORF Transcript_36637/g.53677 Transcript_36637/m.53677 type:complete len:1262 (+) Transcript_36637:127-3912(+)